MSFRKSLVVLSLLAFSGAAQAADGKGMGLGLASIGTIGGTSSMISGWIPLSATAALQPYLGIPSTTGNFNFLAGSALKVNVAGTSAAGFHIGGDVLLGSISGNFTAIFGGLMGVHFNVAPSVMIAADGGPQLAISSGSTDFSLGGFSGILGASIMYLF